jgi:hypothetical protein
MAPQSESTATVLLKLRIFVGAGLLARPKRAQLARACLRLRCVGRRFVLFAACRVVGQDVILRPVANRPGERSSPLDFGL